MTTKELEAKLAVLEAENAKLKAKPAPRKVGTTIKRNRSGGLFVRDASFEAYSTAKAKKYVASANIPWEVAYPLFSSPELLKAVAEFVREQGEEIPRSETPPENVIGGLAARISGK